MISLNYYISRLNKNLFTTLTISLLTSTAILGGFVPNISWKTKEVDFNIRVSAQELDQSTLKRYGQVVMEIEKLRQPALNNIEKIVGKQKTAELTCHQSNTINRLPNNAQQIAREYCDKSEDVVRKYGFSITDFNKMTKQIQQNENLQKKVQDIIRQL